MNVRFLEYQYMCKVFLNLMSIICDNVILDIAIGTFMLLDYRCILLSILNVINVIFQFFIFNKRYP